MRKRCKESAPRGRDLFIVLLAAFSLAMARRAQGTYPWMAPSPTRAVIPLNGQWTLRTPANGTENYISVPFSIPGQAQLVLEKSFRLDSLDGDRQFLLVCYGIRGEARFWLNGNLLGSHSPGYTSFAMPIDPAFLQLGAENKLRVELDGTLHATDGFPLLHKPGSWQDFTGIFRDIYLLVLPPVALRNAKLRVEKLSTRMATIALDLSLARASLEVSEPAYVMVRIIRTESGTLVAESRPEPVHFGGALRSKVRVRLDLDSITPWLPTDPQLYALEVICLGQNGQVIDRWRMRTGFRTVSTDTRRIVLNGAPLRLRAVEWLESLPSADYATEASRLLSEIKSAGCNAIRVVGYPPHPELVAAADSIGLLILEEIPIWKVPGRLLSRPRLLELAKAYAFEMVERDQLHPSVVAWGLGVDLDVWHGETQTAVASLRRTIAELDDRPIYLVVRALASSKIRRELPVDFLLIDAAEDQLDLSPEQLPDRVPAIPIIGYLPGRTSTGASPTQGRGEEGRAYRLWVAGSRLLQDTKAAGLMVRSWTDWESPAPRLPLGLPLSDKMTFGLVSLDGQRRLSYVALRSLFANDEKPNMHPMPKEKSQSHTFLLLAFLLVGLFLWHFRRDRRFRGNIRRVFNYPSSIYEDVRSKRKISAYHTFLQGLFAACGVALLGSSLLVYARQSWLADEIAELVLGTGLGKAVLIWLAWHPVWAFGAMALSGLIALSLLGIIFWFVALLRAYVPLAQSLMFVFWIATAYLPSLVWGAVAYRLMLTSVAFVWLTIILLIGLTIWFLARLVRGTSTILRLPIWAAIAVVCVLLLAANFPWLLLLQHGRAVFDYFGYYSTLILSR